jgi:hypothetical protein
VNVTVPTRPPARSRNIAVADAPDAKAGGVRVGGGGAELTGTLVVVVVDPEEQAQGPTRAINVAKPAKDRIVAMKQPLNLAR